MRKVKKNNEKILPIAVSIIVLLLLAVILLCVVTEHPKLSTKNMQILYMEGTFDYDEITGNYEAGFSEEEVYVIDNEKAAKQIEKLIERQWLFLPVFEDKSEESWVAAIYTENGSFSFTSDGKASVNDKTYHLGWKGAKKAEKLLEAIGAVKEK